VKSKPCTVGKITDPLLTFDVPGLILLAAEGALAALLLALVGALALSYFGACAVARPACSLRYLLRRVLFGETPYCPTPGSLPDESKKEHYL